MWPRLPVFYQRSVGTPGSNDVSYHRSLARRWNGEIDLELELLVFIDEPHQLPDAPEITAANVLTVFGQKVTAQATKYGL